MKNNAELVFDGNLFDRMTSINSLEQAWYQVRKNKGAAGVDGISVTKFADNLVEELGQLSQELRS